MKKKLNDAARPTETMHIKVSKETYDVIAEVARVDMRSVHSLAVKVLTEYANGIIRTQAAEGKKSL